MYYFNKIFLFLFNFKKKTQKNSQKALLSLIYDRHFVLLYSFTKCKGQSKVKLSLSLSLSTPPPNTHTHTHTSTYTHANANRSQLKLKPISRLSW